LAELKEQLQQTLGGSYTLERELGGGGMSRVFVAEETSLGRKVVVKVLPPDLAATVNVERFRREIQLAARLQHPHIVPVLAAGISDGLPYYTMPFIEGESLRARLARSGALPVPEAAKILRDVLSALSYAHEHGVVHRDIKPDNVLLTGNHAVVADFGVAKALSASTNPGSSLTSLGVALGTPAYMSPEQAAADPATDHRADLYGVGAMAYEMLTGHQVFSARSPQAMLAAHAAEKPEPIDRRRPSVPPELSSLIMRSLEKHVADRPQSAGEMLAGLEAAITPSGATTPHIGAIAPRAQKSDRRGLFMAIGSAVVLLTLASSSWYWYDRKSPVVAAAAADTTPSLAVIPFENLGKSEDAYFADGMTEEISSRLGALSGLRVIGRQSAKSYANTNKPFTQVGRELGVAYVLTGSVRWDRSRAGHNRVNVSPALLRTSDGTQLWSEPYEDEVTGVFDIQGKVAERVAAALKVRLTEGQQRSLTARPTDNLDAYDSYLRGKATEAGTWDPTSWSRAANYYSRAASLDPKFADAYAALGRAHLGVYWFRGDPTPQRLELAKVAIDKALALQPGLPAAHSALADYYYHGKLDYQRALKEVEVARSLAPNDPDAMDLRGRIERRQNRWAESIANIKRASELDPRNTQFLSDLCETQLTARQYEEADKTCQRFIEIQPGNRTANILRARNELLRSSDVKATMSLLAEAQKQSDPAELGLGLFDEESRLIWPSLLNPALSQAMHSAPAPPEPTRRVAFFVSRVMLAVYERDQTAATQFADSIIANAPRNLRGTFFDSEMHADLSLAYAAKGDKAKTLEEGRRSMEIVPLERDALRGAVNLQIIALAQVLVGAKDEALTTLQQLLGRADNVSPGLLRVDPWFDSLRGDARFKQLTSGR
jgi:serine/threonine protein kinase/tetratricopeptide (TPR) repeat protein